MAAAVTRFLLNALWCLVGFALLCLFGCGERELQPSEDCPPPAVVFMSPELLQDATTIATPEGCTCDAPLRPALTSAWQGGCSYTYEAKCETCAIDVTWTKGAQP